MKRRRNLIASNRQKSNGEAEKVDDPEIQPLGTSFANLPSSIAIDILLRLPIKSVLICRCVCTSWRNIISDPQFANLHFERAPAEVIIRTDDPKRVSRTLHLLEFEPEKFEREKFSSDDDSDYFCSCDDYLKSHCNRHVKLEVKFKLPLRDAKMALDKMLEARNGGKKKLYISCKPKDDKFTVVNSSNGLLCLCDRKVRNPLVVCNPVTGEFIRLPEGNQVEEFRQRNFDCGFGFHERTNEYKVIRFYDQYVQDPTNALVWLCKDRVAEMHTLGTGIWTSVGVVGNVAYRLCFPTSLNGALHWLHLPSSGIGLSILAFNFESERFHVIPSPPSVIRNSVMMSSDNISMGELSGYLYLCSASFFCPIILWVMKDYGVEESWTKVFSIDKFYAGAFWPFGLYQPLKLFNEGAGLLMYGSCNWLIYFDLKRHEAKFFKVRGTRSRSFEAMAFMPSLVSLKTAMKGDHLQVLNVHSRCGSFKLREENDVLFLAKRDIDRVSLYLSSSSSSDNEDHHSP